jgi:hypothetical protein
MARAFRAAGQSPVIAFVLDPDRKGAQLVTGSEENPPGEEAR